MKKCPVCNSSRFTESQNGKSCKKCGYSNQVGDNIGIPKVLPRKNIQEKKTNLEKIIEITFKSIEEYESFYADFEEDLNPYAKIKQDKEIQKLLKRVITRMDQIKELAMDDK